MPAQFAIAPTTWGAFGVAWRRSGVVRTWLHGRTYQRTLEQVLLRLLDAVEASPSPLLSKAIANVAALLRGERHDLLEVELDMSAVSEFDRRVYEVVRLVPPGDTTTYGTIAKALGEGPFGARDVGQALARNPFAPIVPCHRVIAAGGKLGGYTSPGGALTKRRLLEIEGAAIATSASRQVQLFGHIDRGDQHG